MTTFVASGQSSAGSAYPVTAVSAPSSTLPLPGLPGSKPVTSSSGTASGTAAAVVRQCAGCGGDIHDRYLLHAIDVYWHTGCLRCSACHAPLADIGSTCFTRAGLILCRNDYLRMFGATGSCAACGQLIGPHEMVLRTSVAATPSTTAPTSTSSRSSASVVTSPASSGTTTSTSSVYHVQCFACAACHSRLVAGDRYRVVNGHVICGDHDFGVQSSLATPGGRQQQQHAHFHQQQAAMQVETPISGATTNAAAAVVGTAASKRSSAGDSSSAGLPPAAPPHGRARQKVGQQSRVHSPEN